MAADWRVSIISEQPAQQLDRYTLLPALVRLLVHFISDLTVEQTLNINA